VFLLQVREYLLASSLISPEECRKRCETANARISQLEQEVAESNRQAAIDRNRAGRLQKNYDEQIRLHGLFQLRMFPPKRGKVSPSALVEVKKSPAKPRPRRGSSRIN